jgi:hypothetical protein
MKLRPPAGPRRLREGCAELKDAVALASIQTFPNNAGQSRPSASLSPDEVAVYRTVLQQQAHRGWSHLNISIRTMPLSSHDFESCECFDGLELDDLSAAFHSVHLLTADILAGKQMHLVDPERQSSVVRENDPSNTIRAGTSIKDAVKSAFAGGLFTMSEIAFDKDGRYAIVSYGFRCGMLCGHGATLVLEKIGNEWKVSSRDCGSWIS